MTEFVRAYTGDEGNTLVSVSKAFAENNGLHTVKDAATDERGTPLPPSDGYRTKTSATTATKSTTPTGGSAASKPDPGGADK